MNIAGELTIAGTSGGVLRGLQLKPAWRAPEVREMSSSMREFCRSSAAA